MKIKKIIIKNFRTFQKVEFEFNDFNCIIGKNDSGKSTLFAALEWFFSNDKELNNYDINSNLEYEKEDISVELYFTEATFHPEFIGEEFLDAEGYVCIKKGLTNPKSFDSDFIKPIPYYSLRIFNFMKRIDRSILSFCKCEDLMKECFDLGINKNFLKGQLSLFENCSDESSKTLFRSRNAFLIPKMRQTLYNYYSKLNYQVIEDERRFSESEWFEWMYESSEFWVPPFMIFTPQTPINDYLNSLFNHNFLIFDNEKTEEIAQKISNAIKRNKTDAEDKISIEMFNKYFECNFFPTNKYIPIVTTKNLEMIPFQNRGDGFQQKVKNAVFRLFAEHSHKDSCILAFEEPETHLHPSAQIEMFNTIKSLSNTSNYQVFMTTHSPYIVNELAKDPNNKIIIVERYEQKKESYINRTVKKRVLPYESMNEINYIAFDEPSIEYHIELFGFIHNELMDKYENDSSFKNDWDSSIVTPDKNGVLVKVGVSTIKGVDVWLDVKNSAQKYNWYETKSFIKEKRTLPYCVRNNIDHPLTDDASNINKHRAYINNSKFEKYVQQSIDIMRNAIINNPNVF